MSSAGTSAKTQPVVVKLRPSDAHRWLVCRASPGYVAQLDAAGKLVKEVMDYTEEGIKAHELAALVLRNSSRPTSKDERDMVLHVMAYAEHVGRLIKKHHPHTVLLVEHKVDVFYSDRTGYIDAAVLVVDKKNHLQHVYAIDLKYGRGVSVKATKNAQLSIYLKSLLRQLADTYTFDKKTKASITIWQPRVQGEKTERTWDTTVSDVDNLCAWIEEVAKDILANPFNQPFEPSEEACQFCPAAALCEARAGYLLGDVEDVTGAPTVLLHARPEAPVDLPDVKTLTPSQVSRLLKVAGPLKKWLGKVEDYAESMMVSGAVRYPGYKVVKAKDGHRKWADEAKAEEFLRRMFPKDVVTPPDVISPAKAEELMKERNVRQKMWDEFAGLITRAEGKNTMAPEDDERPSVDVLDQANEEFGDVPMPGEELL